MWMNLNWQDGGKPATAAGLTCAEKELVAGLQGSAVYDLDAGGSAAGGERVAWYRAELKAEELQQAVHHAVHQSAYILLDFGVTRHIRKLSLYLDGQELGRTECSDVDTQFIIPASWLRGHLPHSLLLVVIEGFTMNMWLKGVGLRPYTPPGCTTLTDELPRQADVQPLQGLGALTAAALCEEQLQLSFSCGMEGRLALYGNGVFRFTAFWPAAKEDTPLIDQLVLDEWNPILARNIELKNGTEELHIPWSNLTVILRKYPFELSVVQSDTGVTVFRHTAEEMNSRPLVGMAVQLDPGEAIFGLGENAAPSLNKRGQCEDIWVAHDFVHCDIPVPFYISTRGYGLYLNNSCHSRFDMGKKVHDRALIWAAGGRLDYFFIYGPSPKTIVSRYTGITGQAKLPPRWAFGFWQSRTGADSAEAVLAKAARFREEGIPLDVIGIDPPWMDNTTEFKWNGSSFPHPEELMGKLKEQKLHLILWSSPFVNPACGNYAEGVEAGHFMRDEAGRSQPVCWWKGHDAGLVDFTSPQAVDWWREQIKPLLELGVDGLKIDGGDGSEVPAGIFNASGRAGSEFHNLYPVYFAKAVYGIFQEARPNQRVLVWERTGFAGSGKYPCTWGGDQLADYSGTRVLVKAGQAAGLAGIPFWSQDVGGFCKCEGTTESFFIRSYQWGLLSPLSRAHGDRTEPWSYGGRAQDIVKEYIRLRYRLLPYLYSLAYGAVLEGLPVMRPLFYEYPDDPQVYSCDYQYLLGDSLLVAPIVEETGAADLSAVRSVYFPAGKWIDYWSEHEYEGGHSYSYRAEIEKLPLFIKKGALLLMAPDITRTADYSGRELFLHYYPAGPGEVTQASHYLDDGLSLDYREGGYDRIDFSISRERDGSIRLRVATVVNGYSTMGSSLRLMLIVHKGAEQKSASFSCNYSIGMAKETGFRL
ncbi:MAG: alpha-glucosidase [Paenibacillaceae bacterium]|jgi:alpha-glucosidase (family GH31 glycosyl hydrolase)|nr:alpha-glucosidase [Paenibacillaceae bacterium]